MKRIFLALLAVCIFAAYSWADIRIRFARGHTSAASAAADASVMLPERVKAKRCPQL